jgi:hypothetical protein
LQPQGNSPASLSPAAAAAAAGGGGGGFSGLSINVDMTVLMDQGLMSPGSPGYGDLSLPSPLVTSAAAAAAGGYDSPLQLQSPAAAAAAAAAASSVGALRQEWEQDHVHPNPIMGVGRYRLAVTGSQLRCLGGLHCCCCCPRQHKPGSVHDSITQGSLRDRMSQTAEITCGTTSLLQPAD